MSYRRHHVVEHAITVLDAYGLGDLSMRRLGAELGVQPSALYHHFKDEQTHLQAGSAGAIPDEPDDAHDGADFAVGLAIVVDGIRARAGAPVTGGPSGPT